jgi:hypothetical protein
MRQHRVMGSGPLGCNVTACGSDHAGRLLVPVLFYVAGFRSGTVYSLSADSIHSQGSEIGIHTTQTRREPIHGGSSAASMPQRVCSA